MYRFYHLKYNPTTINYGTKMKSEAGPSTSQIVRTNCDIRVKVTLAARPMLMPVAQKMCCYLLPDDGFFGSLFYDAFLVTKLYSVDRVTSE
jgi:hypothetical protein